jgi:serine/threonine protein kinase
MFTTQLLDIIIASPDGKTLKNGTGIFLIMEYVENDINKLLRDTSVKLSEDHIITIAYNLLCSINFLHTAGVMHRDIKPGNILIDDMCQVKLCDFGFARCIIEDDTKKSKKPLIEIERQGTADTLGSLEATAEISDGG